MNMEEETLLAMRSYAKRTLDVEMEAAAGQSGLVPLLDTSVSDTPEPNPAKKSKLSSDSSAVSVNEIYTENGGHARGNY